MNIEKQRIAKVVARSGYCSRRQAEKLILENRISINDTIITTPAIDVDYNDIIKIDNQLLPKAEKTRLWAFYKPIGVITTRLDPKGRKTIYDILPRDMPRVISIGRLDINSEGLLLLTNNGELSRKLELPANKFPRIYKVRIYGKLHDEYIKQMESAITVDNFQYGKIIVEREQVTGKNSWVKVTLFEGKNREIRKVFEHFSIQVNRLIRISYANYKLGNMKPGEVQEISGTILTNAIN